MGLLQPRLVAERIVCVVGRGAASPCALFGSMRCIGCRQFLLRGNFVLSVGCAKPWSLLHSPLTCCDQSNMAQCVCWWTFWTVFRGQGEVGENGASSASPPTTVGGAVAQGVGGGQTSSTKTKPASVSAPGSESVVSAHAPETDSVAQLASSDENALTAHDPFSGIIE